MLAEASTGKENIQIVVFMVAVVYVSNFRDGIVIVEADFGDEEK